MQKPAMAEVDPDYLEAWCGVVAHGTGLTLGDARGAAMLQPEFTQLGPYSITQR